jgi:hypothetical protein
MNVKSAFLNGVIQQKVYVRQPSGFESLKYLDRVYKLSKTLYELKQVPRAQYARLKMFLLEHIYVMRSVDKTLFTLNHGTDLYKWSVPVSFLTIERTGVALHELKRNFYMKIR